MPLSRRVRSPRLLLPLLLALVVAGCGGGPVQFDGMTVDNADEVLAEADDVFDDLIADDVDRGTTTVADRSQCFFRRDGDESVHPEFFCGPVRQLGIDEDDAWFPLPIDMTQVDRDNETLTASLAATEPGEPVSVDIDELFRTDGAGPVDASALDDPRAPEAPVEDFAALVPRDGAVVDAEFEQLDEPYTLITTAATVTIEATADLDVIPQPMVDVAQGSGPDDGASSDATADSSSAPFYRPAEGQRIQAWDVTIGAPPSMAPQSEESLFGSDHDARDASVSLALAVGSQRLSLIGHVSGSDEYADEQHGSVTITCAAVQCPDRNQERYVLVLSASDDEPPSLVATADGVDQAVSLDDGTVTSEVSQVAYSRESLTRQASTAWGSKTILVRTEDQLEADQECCYGDDLTYTFGGEVQRVYLSPFDYTRGWAPAGKAWLVIPVMTDPQNVSLGEVSIDWAKTWTLTVGDDVLPNEPDAGSGNDAVFLVDETFTAGTFTYSPAGSVATSDQTYPLTTDDPLTLDVAFP